MAMWRVLSALLLVGCGGTAGVPEAVAPIRSGPASEPVHVDQRPAIPSAPSAPTALTPAEIAAQAGGSVVVVQTSNAMGAGFVVGRGLVATCLHVVEGANEIVVRTSNGVEHAVTSVMAYDKLQDVAVLGVDSMAAPALQLGDSTTAKPGDAVTVIGHPEGLESTVSTGVVSAIRKFKSGLVVLQVTAPISHGSSGGPVLNDQGAVIGLTRSLRSDGQALNFATPVSALKKILASGMAPISIADFAVISAPQATGGQGQGTPAPAKPAVATGPARPAFPTTVAGFTFGMSVEQAKYVCATPASQWLSQHGQQLVTQLDVDGVAAECPFDPQPLDFMSSPVLIFAANHLVRVGLLCSSFPLARERLVSKYGDPLRAIVKGSWEAWTPRAERRATEVAWQLDGGLLFLGLVGKRSSVLFISDAEDELKKQGF